MSSRKEFKETDYLNKEFEYLTILKFTEIKFVSKGAQFSRYCLCRCRCGDEKEYALHNIKSGRSKSCGCKPYVNSNPYIKTKIYQTYHGMISRCYNRTSTRQWENYGGRGIKVCDRWRESFYNFLDDMGQPPTSRHSIDRINNDGDYEPSNCRWATQRQQMNNTRLTNELTGSNLAKQTGYTRERIRQLTRPTTSAPCTKQILKNYVKQVIKTKKRTHYIYVPDAIEFLINRRLGVTT